VKVSLILILLVKVRTLSASNVPMTEGRKHDRAVNVNLKPSLILMYQWRRYIFDAYAEALVYNLPRIKVEDLTKLL